MLIAGLAATDSSGVSSVLCSSSTVFLRCGKIMVRPIALREHRSFTVRAANPHNVNHHHPRNPRLLGIANRLAERLNRLSPYQTASHGASIAAMATQVPVQTIHRDPQLLYASLTT